MDNDEKIVSEESVVAKENPTPPEEPPGAASKTPGKRTFLKGLLVGALIMTAVFAIAIVIIQRNGSGDGATVSKETQRKISILKQIIEESYLYSDDIDEDVLQQRIIKGYVEGLSEPYSVYYDEAETKALMESTSGEFGGIGVVVSQNIDTMLITFNTVYKDSPADKAGLKDGDMLYKVDGKDITGKELDYVVSKIRGKKGTEVEITVLRSGTGEEYTCKVKRATIKAVTVSYEMKEDLIGYIAVSGFEDVTADQFKNAITELKSQGMKKLVIDLRDNPGGNLSTVCEMLDYILPEGTIVYTKDKHNVKQVYSSDAENYLDIPMAVLINENSASASEIFAGAVQDYEAGAIVGKTSFGKGIVQSIFDLGDGTSLKLTTSEYFTPKDRNIHGKGIKPDIEAEYKYNEADPDADSQLQAAVDYLKGKAGR